MKALEGLPLSSQLTLNGLIGRTGQADPGMAEAIDSFKRLHRLKEFEEGVLDNVKLMNRAENLVMSGKVSGMFVKGPIRKF